MKKPDSSNGHSDDFSLALNRSTDAIHKISSRLGDINKQTIAINLLQAAVDKLTNQHTSITQQLASLENRLHSLPTLEAFNPVLKDHFALLETSFNDSHKIFRETLTKAINDFVATQREKQLKLLEQINTQHQQEQKALVAVSQEHSTGFKQQLDSSLASADTNLQSALAKLSTDIIDANYNWHRIYFVSLVIIVLLLLAHLVFYVPSPSLFNHSANTQNQQQPESATPSPSTPDLQHKRPKSPDDKKKPDVPKKLP